ncbi:MAG: hypothetical protein IJC28_07555, partial [Mailhella sp.]|nr:hypothetical protein [Mailhella sp.]
DVAAGIREALPDKPPHLPPRRAGSSRAFSGRCEPHAQIFIDEAKMPEEVDSHILRVAFSGKILHR